MTRPVTGDALLAALSCVSRPLRTEHSPLTSLPPATLSGIDGQVGRQNPFTLFSTDLDRGVSGSEFDPGKPEAAGTSLHTDAAEGSEPPSRLCRTLVRLRLDGRVAQAAGTRRRRGSRCRPPMPRPSHTTTLTFTSPVSIGTEQAPLPLGVAVTPSPLATVSCVLVEATPESDDDGDVRARVGGGRGRAGRRRCRTIRTRRVAGVGLRATTGELQGVEKVERDEATVGLHVPCAGLRAGRGRHRTQQRHGHQPHPGDPDPNPHPIP